MDVKYAIQTDKAFIKETVRAILSTILFQRVLGSVVPQTRSALGVSYPCIVSEEIDTLLEDKVSRLLQTLDMNTSGSEKSGGKQIGVQFFEKRSKKSSWFGTRTQQDFCWEQWVLTVTKSPTAASTNQEIESRRQQSAAKLKEILLDIAVTASSNKDHIPAITTTSPVPFPYKIVTELDQPHTSEDRWGASFMKYLGDQ